MFKYGLFGNGYDKEGFNKFGYDKEGYGRDGFNQNGYNREGYNRAGFDINGYNCNGFDIEGFDKHGYNKEGYGRTRQIILGDIMDDRTLSNLVDAVTRDVLKKYKDNGKNTLVAKLELFIPSTPSVWMPPSVRQ